MLLFFCSPLNFVVMIIIIIIVIIIIITVGHAKSGIVKSGKNLGNGIITVYSISKWGNDTCLNKKIPDGIVGMKC